MNKEENILHCPFCGEEAEFMIKQPDMGKPSPNYDYEWCRCSKHTCNANKTYHKTSKWNTRSSEPLDELDIAKYLYTNTFDFNGDVPDSYLEKAKAICAHFCKPVCKRCKGTKRIMIYPIGEHDKEYSTDCDLCTTSKPYVKICDTCKGTTTIPTDRSDFDMCPDCNNPDVKIDRWYLFNEIVSYIVRNGWNNKNKFIDAENCSNLTDAIIKYLEERK